MFESARNPKASRWNLSGQITESGAVCQIPIACSPFLVGRQSGSSLSLPCQSVSKIHAELRLIGNDLRVCDLSSTNGTFVNGIKIAHEVVVRAGDLLQFGNVIFQVLGGDRSIDADTRTIQTDASETALAMVQFEKLMNSRAVVPFFQPIVTIGSHKSTACEVLGRSRLFGVRTPHAMFHAAGRLHQEAQLSRLLRAVGAQIGAALPDKPNLFLNTHPSELQTPELIQSLRELRDDFPDLHMTLEIHEAAVTEINAIRELRAILKDLDIGLAYDDFGAGQSRLFELADVVPDCLKFDMEFIRSIDLAPADRLKVISTLVRMASELGTTPLAEGIETEGEAKACQELGFVLAQGYYFGRPMGAREFAAHSADHVVPASSFSY
jgi:EAL domain-containing protein (putative c-di-GMP-specific phosphodiesterase class I)